MHKNVKNFLNCEIVLQAAQEGGGSGQSSCNSVGGAEEVQNFALRGSSRPGRWGANRNFRSRNNATIQHLIFLGEGKINFLGGALPPLPPP